MRRSSSWARSPARRSRPSSKPGAEVSIWREASRELLASRAADSGVVPRVHVKHDSGMGRLGLRDAAETEALIEAVASDERLELAGVWTHLATADEDEDSFMRRAARCIPRGGPSREGAPSRDHTPRRQQRGHASRSRIPLRHGALRRCHLRPRPVRQRLRRAGSGARARAASPTSPTSKASSPARAPATAARGRRTLDAGSAPVPIGYGDGWRRGLSNTGGARSSGAGAARSWAPSRWTTSRSTSGRSTTSPPFDEVGADRRAQRRTNPCRGAWRTRLERSTTRSRPGSRPRVDGSTIGE